MTPRERDELKEALTELDEAMEKIDVARRPLDAAMNAVFGIKEMLLDRHEAEIVGKCETCMEPIFSGDIGYDDGEVSLCEDHAPTWGDLRDLANEASPNALEPDERENCLAAVRAHVDGGGALTEKPVAEL